MKHYPTQLLFGMILVCFSLVSCQKENAETKEKIVELEEKVINLESEKIGLEADVISLQKTQGGMNAADAKALTERKEFLEKEVQRLLPFEVQVNDLTRKNEDLATKLAAATMSGTSSATATAEAASPGGELSKSVEQSFVSIEGDLHSGGGFLVGEADKVYLYTAASVLTGNQKLTIRTSGGQALTKFGALEFCEGVDIVRMQVMDEVEFKMEMAAADAVIASQMPVMALGMQKNSSVVVAEKTTVGSVQGTTLELSNNPLSSAIGGPIIHALSGKVIGVIGQKVVVPPMWVNVEYAEPVQQVIAQINRPLTWTPGKIGSFIAEAKRLQEFDDATRLALAVASVRLSGGMPQLDGMVGGSQFTVSQILTKHEAKSLAQTLLKWKGDDPNKKITASEADIKKRWRGVMGDALSFAQRGVAEINVAQFSWYHRSWAEASLKERQKAVDQINEQIAENK
jgi:hypothetical protein